MFNLTRRLPWVVALVAFWLYALTLSHGVTLTSLPLTAKVAGWDWTPLARHPLLWLLTLPVRLLPEAMVPLFLNLFSAATGALTLGVLARTLKILPWGKRWKDNWQQVGALPVLLAVALCGLEFSFWQEATAATGEMLDMLLLASGLWLLLEYRLRRDSRWLNAAALVWGLGMAEDWAMLFLLPLFIAGMMWQRGIHFFQWKFLLRMTGLGLAGFSLYALLPLANGLNPHSPWSLGEAWTASLTQTNNAFQMLYYGFWRSHRFITLVVTIYYLMPALACLVRLRDTGTRHLTIGSWFQLWVYRGLRGVLLLACLWLAFDPITGPRQILQPLFSGPLPLLTFDYLNALGAGFLAGNLLLLFQGSSPHRHQSTADSQWRQLAVPGAAVALGLIIIGLAARNAPAILRLNFHPLQRFGELATVSLPTGGGVILSDQPQKLTAFQAALAHHHDRCDWLAVDTRELPLVKYRAQLERRRPAGWLTDKNRHELTPVETVELLEQVSHRHRLCYLHSSYGYYFERFYLEPAGGIYEMKLRDKNSLDTLPLPAAAITANENFWTSAWQKNLAPLTNNLDRPPPAWLKKIHILGLTPAASPQNRLLAEWYSFALDAWGVTLQRQGHLPEAQTRLEQALQLATNNLSAQVSLACNTNLQAGHRLGLANLNEVASQLENLQRLSQILKNCGPFDDPVLGYLLGATYQKTGMPLQALQEFERTRTLVPGVPAPEFILAELYTRLHHADRAQAIIAQLRDEVKKLPDNGDLDFNLALLEANYWLAQTNLVNAHSAFQTLLRQHPDDENIARRVLKAYLTAGDFTNALQMVNTQLAKTPDDVDNQNLKAAILIDVGRVAEALPLLDHILTITNLPTARFNRASARLASHDDAAAAADYHELETSGQELGRTSYGLAIIAEHRHDTNEATRYLQLCLTNTPTGTALWRQASNHLQMLAPATKAK